MPAQLFIACVTDYSGGLYCARAECVGTYTHTINAYTLYFYHFDTPLQTVNQCIPTFIHSFVISFTISFTHSNFHSLDSFTILTNSIHSVIHSQFRSIRFLRSLTISTNSIHSSNQFNSSSEFRQQSFRA